jgi:ABC-type multidrug transport system fused ATPase/permease subunit
LFDEFSELTDKVSAIQEFYKLSKVENKIVDGDEAYPNSTVSTNKGMALELRCAQPLFSSISTLIDGHRNVCFAYPGTKSKDNAIKNLSLKIPAGHLVVIVGSNGSGKSTIIKLLNRLYDVDSGEILVDGIPINKYRLSDLHKVQALLSQDHSLYPLTLAENIGLGNPDHINDMEMVLRAADAGGASELIKRLKDGVQTVLQPIQTAYGHQLDKYKKLQSILENLEQENEVSGGEKQRLVA